MIRTWDLQRQAEIAADCHRRRLDLVVLAAYLGRRGQVMHSDSGLVESATIQALDYDGALVVECCSGEELRIVLEAADRVPAGQWSEDDEDLELVGLAEYLGREVRAELEPGRDGRLFVLSAFADGQLECLSEAGPFHRIYPSEIWRIEDQR